MINSIILFYFIIYNETLYIEQSITNRMKIFVERYIIPRLSVNSLKKNYSNIIFFFSSVSFHSWTSLIIEHEIRLFENDPPLVIINKSPLVLTPPVHQKFSLNSILPRGGIPSDAIIFAPENLLIPNRVSRWNFATPSLRSRQDPSPLHEDPPRSIAFSTP